APAPAVPVAPAPVQPAPATSPEAQAALATARQLEAAALAAFPPNVANISQTPWNRAAKAAEAAVAAAPNDPNALRLRAEVYSITGFWSRASAAWQAYQAAGGNLDATAARQAGNVQYQLGYAAYGRNDRVDAAAYFQRAAAIDPTNARAVQWEARLALEGGNAPAAAQLYARAASLDPNDSTSRYFANIAAKAATFGTPAVTAFTRGVLAYQAKDPATALADFRQAAASSPNFTEAQRWLGRVALETGLGAEAAAAWQRVVALEGNTPTDAYFLAYAKEVAAFGLPAVQAFRNGYDRYVAGDKAAALAQFQAAVAARPDYAKAWQWLGRAAFETGDFAQAANAYAQAVKLDPTDTGSAYWLKQAQARE
ncbi:MAG TPA: tetratricopeptide repeat protein, partial [Deinococcales bacterium]|nr:tetratricopeptide repeat protein [Deinococcales bacterium]